MSLTPISFTGVSKFVDDFQVILERAFEVATLPINGLQTEQTINLAQQQQLGTLAAAVQSLGSAFSSLGTQAQNGAITASSSDTAVATVTVTGSASPVDVDVSVTSAAAVAQETTTTALSDRNTSAPEADGIYKLTLGAVQTTIDLLTIGSGRTAGTTGSSTPATPVSVQVDFSNGLTGSITADLNSFFVAASAPSGAGAGDTVSVTFASADNLIDETITTAGLAGGEDAAAIAALLNAQITANANLNGKVSFSDEGGNLKLVVSDTAGQGFEFTSSNTGSVVTGLESGGTVGGHSAEEIAAALNAQVALDQSLISAGVTFIAQGGEVRAKGNTKFDITGTDAAQATGFVSGLSGTQTVEGYDNTLDGLNGYINANSTTLDVKATIINTSSDPINPNYHLTLTTTETGTTTLKLENSSSTNLVTATDQGSDAVFSVNGLPDVTNSGNVITDFAPGLNLTIVGAGAATISAQTNRTSLSNSLSGLVANYNILVDAVQSQIGESAGALSGNVTVRQAQQVLRLATSFLGSGTIKSMVEVGLELDNKGKLSFNALTFNLLTDSQVTDAITFIGDTSTGFAGNAATLLDSLGDPVNGQIQAAIASLQDSDTKLTGEIEEAQERVDALIANLEARFAAADVLLSQLEAQQSLLTTLLVPPESLNI